MLAAARLLHVPGTKLRTRRYLDVDRFVEASEAVPAGGAERNNQPTYDSANVRKSLAASADLSCFRRRVTCGSQIWSRLQVVSK